MSAACLNCEHARADHSRVLGCTYNDGDTWVCPCAYGTAAADERIYGMCTACGAVEVALVKATGTRDLSGVGEHHAYPTGYGCEACS